MLLLYTNYVMNSSCIPYVIPIPEAENEAQRGEVICTGSQLVSVREGIRIQTVSCLNHSACYHPGSGHWSESLDLGTWRRKEGPDEQEIGE